MTANGLDAATKTEIRRRLRDAAVKQLDEGPEGDPLNWWAVQGINVCGQAQDAVDDNGRLRTMVAEALSALRRGGHAPDTIPGICLACDAVRILGGEADG